MVVTYSPVPYTLTVIYQYTDGSTAAESHQEQLFIGAAFLGAASVEQFEVVAGSQQW